MYPQSMFLSKNMKIVKKFQLKIVTFTDVKNRCMLHGRVYVICLFLILKYLYHISLPCKYVSRSSEKRFLLYKLIYLTLFCFVLVLLNLFVFIGHFNTFYNRYCLMNNEFKIL